MFSKLSSFSIPKATFTWKSQVFPTTQTAEVSALINDANPGSLSALLPDFLVIPNAVKILFLVLGGFEKNLVSIGFAPGQPPSI